MGGTQVRVHRIQSFVPVNLDTLHPEIVNRIDVVVDELVAFKFLRRITNYPNLIPKNTSLFTVAISYGTITNKLKFALDRGIIDSSLVVTLLRSAR